jgi:nondiscriminating glutamyl-tRNA synthetase
MDTTNTALRVRFAPSPTGTMHLGNVRTALLNYLFAQQKNGTFVLRIEDTDPDRNFDPNGKQIIHDLAWLDLVYTEGGTKSGPYAPYYQSQRTEIYQSQLDILKEKKVLYRCFCTAEELERKRARSIALKVAPRYDRTCLKLTPEEVEKRLEQGMLFIWRFKIPENYTATVHDLAHGALNFDMNHFSDFPVSRSDGTFTFIFANCVDDMLMKISYVLRGEDHLSNTANQVLLYETFGVIAPLFWHLPIICNVDGKKLSKRDFGFSLHDLKNSGFLPEALTNYLAIIGGSFAHEIMDMQELIKAMNFDSIKPVSNIRYDVEKLKWVNHKWIQNYDPEKLANTIIPYLEPAYPQIKNLDHKKVVALIQTIKSELVTLNDVVAKLNFYFEEPHVPQETVLEHIPTDLQQPFKALLYKNSGLINNPDLFIDTLKEEAKESSISIKLLFTILRLLLTGSVHGPAVKDIIQILGSEETKKRLEKFVG